MKSLIFLIFLACLSCGRSESKIVIEIDSLSIKSEVREMLHSYHQSIKEFGLIGEFEYLDHSAEFFWVPPGYQTALTYDSVESILKQSAKGFKSAEFSWDTLRLSVLSPSIVNYTGIVSGTMIDTSDVVTEVSIIESGTIIKRPNGWKLLSGQSATIPNSNLP